MTKSKISWCDETWNPVRGCSRVSEGCRHCYAEIQAGRIVRMGRGKPTPYDGLVQLVNGEPRWTGEVSIDTDRLAEPLRWQKPRKVFVDSMSDLFYDRRPSEHIAAVFGVMAATPHITYQILTKYAQRMRAWFAWVDDETARSDWMRDPRRPSAAPAVHKAMEWLARTMPPNLPFREGVSDQWPLPNVWIGVSVEDQAAADERIPELLETPASVRFLSCEPLLEAIDLSEYADPCSVPCGEDPWPPFDWLIAGCESGAGARPCSVASLRALRDHCQAHGIPFFLKQAVPGCGCPATHTHSDVEGCETCTCTWSAGDTRVGSVESGVTFGPGSRRKPGGVVELPYLDGEQHVRFPGGRG